MPPPPRPLPNKILAMCLPTIVVSQSYDVMFPTGLTATRPLRLHDDGAQGLA